MITGFNTDVKYRGTVYHVQTEDKGQQNPLIETLVYKKGEILASRRLPYADIIADPASWVEITANERHPGGTSTQTDVAAGVLDSRQGRIVSIPRRVNGELYGSFLPGSKENLQRALDGLIEFLPSRNWFDKAETEAYGD